MNKLKYEIQSVDIQSFEVQDVPGINVPQINYGSAIGGKDAPEAGADVTYNNPQNVAWLSDAGAMAYENLVEKAKLGTTIIDGGYIKSDLLIANNIITGTMSAARIDGGDINGVTITGVTITGGTLQTSNSGKRIVIASDKIEIYNSSNIVVGTIEGAGQSGIFDLIGLNYVTAGDFTAIGATLDGLIGIDTSLDLNLSTRKSGGGGGDIKVVAEIGQNIIAYNNFIPNSDGSLYLGNSTYGWGRVYLGASSRYLYDNAGTLYFNGSAVGAGEVNTASNKGGTYGLYSNKTGADLQFKGISVSSRLTITSYTDYLYIDHQTGSGYNHIPSLGTSYYSLRNSGSGVAAWSRAVYIGASGWYLDYNSDGIVSSKNLMPATDGSQYLGNSTHGWGRVYIGSSGFYMYEYNSKLYGSTTIGATKFNIEYYANNPSSAGDITNYSSGATQQFRGRPGSGGWAGSFDMTAY